jgi:peroxiredoxin
MATEIPGKAELREGKPVPGFVLPTVSGEPTGPAALRSKYNMVLVFLPSGPPAESYLHALSTLYPEILDEHARVLAVLAGDLDATRELAARARAPFTLLADADGRVTGRMLGGPGRAGLCVADRFGDVFYLQVEGDAAALPFLRAALDWLQFIQLQCPE